MASMDNIVAGMNATSQQEQQAAMETATSLWQRYGKSMPFGQWVNNEVVKAKTAGIYKEGMTFKQVVEANLKQTGIEIEPMMPGSNDKSHVPVNPSGNTSMEVTASKPFRIGGMNGYVVLGGIALGVAGLIYLGTKFLSSKHNATN